MARLEEANFWFRSRNRLIVWAIASYCSELNSFLEIGCGTGYVLSGISAAFPEATLQGSEIFTAGLDFAASRLPSVKFMQMDARRLPFHQEFDAIGAFDVLEHIAEDELVLASIRDALRPGGAAFLTVPQHPWLWSNADKYAQHIRRYRSACLHRKIEIAGFQILRSTSFVTLLLPAMIASRFVSRARRVEKFDPSAEFLIPPVVNTVFYRLLSAELAVIRQGINFPVGGSRLIVAKKT
ncbi:MAG TPA: class I SAM-dependent methyltransferase [Phycisphaerae bacterium]|nr:class I SAM-dependent methyltransferase [Phycisphaerae bacterium]